ncbi:hypothetical protein EGR_04631 [Echinococcus granulosus]|uniref:Uncharacterized protein n=1 Tax=Echinococcus granulosus TaxID=6210 RepID=W6UQ79_ECHGR|nr:hypothetical protein EGR_04631 [Echinococcus granulosus]EUB60437.1 hypothetical protein EGR_04631 [Echinococcus granulosus]
MVFLDKRRSGGSTQLNFAELIIVSGKLKLWNVKSCRFVDKLRPLFPCVIVAVNKRMKHLHLRMPLKSLTFLMTFFTFKYTTYETEESEIIVELKVCLID